MKFYPPSIPNGCCSELESVGEMGKNEIVGERVVGEMGCRRNGLSKKWVLSEKWVVGEMGCRRCGFAPKRESCRRGGLSDKWVVGEVGGPYMKLMTRAPFDQ